MVTKWLHLSELGGDPWVLPIWTAVNKAVEAKKVQALSKDQRELGVHVSARLNILPRIASRINTEAKVLCDIAKTHKPEHVFTATTHGAALHVDDDLKYQLIADINAFLVEVNSCAELMSKFLQLLYAQAGIPIPDNKLTDMLRQILSKSNVSGDWFTILDRNRNFVTHNGTPYIAIDVSNQETWDLLIMKENLVKFDDTKKFFTLSELGAVAEGFSNARVALQKHLIDLYAGL
ncbi:MAG: hypothetical protein IPK20_01525 [Betaproteobacteria bacterium]|nr:hypothetical protein [Betaproteobacteria bacterium]